jgi:hypothetical protein
MVESSTKACEKWKNNIANGWTTKYSTRKHKICCWRLQLTIRNLNLHLMGDISYILTPRCSWMYKTLFPSSYNTWSIRSTTRLSVIITSTLMSGTGERIGLHFIRNDTHITIALCQPFVRVSETQQDGLYNYKPWLAVITRTATNGVSKSNSTAHQGVHSTMVCTHSPVQTSRVYIPSKAKRGSLLHRNSSTWLLLARALPTHSEDRKNRWINWTTANFKIVIPPTFNMDFGCSHRLRTLDHRTPSRFNFDIHSAKVFVFSMCAPGWGLLVRGGSHNICSLNLILIHYYESVFIQKGLVTTSQYFEFGHKWRESHCSLMFSRQLCWMY